MPFRPAQDRWLVRALLALFAGLAGRALASRGPSPFPSELLALMVLPVFATLLDGIVTGGLLVALGLAGDGFWLARHGEGGSAHDLAVVFSMLGIAGLYICCVAHTWMFRSLMQRRRQSTAAAQATHSAVERLAATLSHQVFELTQRLRLGLAERGLQGLDAVKELNATLKQARDERPPEIPHNALDPQSLLQDLRRTAFGVFLRVALGLSCLALAAMLLLHPPEWQLAAGMALLCALLLIGAGRDTAWAWRLRTLVGLGLATCLADVILSRHTPPASSLLFSPVIIFFAAMLDELWAAALACAVALALVLLCGVLEPDAWSRPLLGALALALPLLIAVSAATLPIYRSLLERLKLEEDGLALELASYRRLVSTFFHDLANPLAVLQTLASLPVELQLPDDLLRAERMAQRLDAVVQSARQTLLGAAPIQASTTLAQLGGELYDLFQERLREKDLHWSLAADRSLRLPQHGPMLRDAVLGHLLSNAIKFSPPGGAVELKAWKQDARVHLQFSDHGGGVPTTVMQDLAQGRSPQSRPGTQGETGSGFGLLLAQAYAAELGGRLILRPGPTGGTEAELVLPAT